LKKFLAWADHDRGSVFVLAAVVGFFFLPALIRGDVLIWPHSGLGSDISYRHWPDLIRYAENLRQGRVVLWDPSVALGRPLAGDPATLFVYPFGIAFALLPPAFAFNTLDALHVLLAGVFMFLFLRLGYSVARPAALLSAFTFAFMPKFISHMAGGHVGVVWGLIWAPAVLLGLKLAIDGSWLAAAWAGLALAVQLPNHIQQPYYAAVIGSAFWLWHTLPVILRRQWKQVARLVAVYFVWLIAFGLTSAVVLAPLIEMLPYNSRADFTVADANLYALPPQLLFTLLAPSNFQFPEWTMYLGLLPLLLALVGWVSGSQSVKWFFGILAVFALIYAIGLSTPLFQLAFTFIPGFRLLRVPTRLWFFGGLAVAVLAGFGADRVTDSLRETLRQRRPHIIRIAGLYFVAAVTGWIGYIALFGEPHYLLTFQIISIAALVALGVRWLAGQITASGFQWMLIPVLLLDLIPVATDQIDLIQPQNEFLRSTPALDYVAAQPGLFRVYSPAGDLPYSVAAERGVESLEGLLAFQIGHAVNAIHKATGCDKLSYATAIPPCLTDEVQTAIPDPARLGALNVRYILSKSPLNDPNFKRVLNDSPAVYENLLWQPRARVDPNGDVQIVKRRAGEYDLIVETTEAAQLILSETWLPGWQVTVNGQPQPVERVDGALLGVALEPGRHTVHLFYLPLGWRVGWPISLGSVGALVVWSSLVLWRKRM